MTTEYYIFSSLPFAVCLTWLIILLLNLRRNDLRKRQLALFAAVCAVLYFCHAIFFISGGSNGNDALWRTCSLIARGSTMPTSRIRKLSTRYFLKCPKDWTLLWP